MINIILMKWWVGGEESSPLSRIFLSFANSIVRLSEEGGKNEMEEHTRPIDKDRWKGHEKSTMNYPEPVSNVKMDPSSIDLSISVCSISP